MQTDGCIHLSNESCCLGFFLGCNKGKKKFAGAESRRPPLAHNGDLVLTWRQFAFTGHDTVITGFVILFCESIKATGEMKSGCLCLAVAVFQNSFTVLIRCCDFILALKALQNSSHVFIPLADKLLHDESSGNLKTWDSAA